MRLSSKESFMSDEHCMDLEFVFRQKETCVRAVPGRASPRVCLRHGVTVGREPQGVRLPVVLESCVHGSFSSVSWFFCG